MTPNLKKWYEENIPSLIPFPVQPTTKITRKHRGDYSEILACAWLIEKGFDVFRNQSSRGIVDIVAINTKNMEVHFFDVKSARKNYNKDGSISEVAGKLSTQQIEKGVERILVFVNGDIRID